jgi:hypothetical protein
VTFVDGTEGAPANKFSAGTLERKIGLRNKKQHEIRRKSAEFGRSDFFLRQ